MSTFLVFLIRGLVGFIVGGVVAAASAGLTLVTIRPIPLHDPSQPNYGPVALSLIVIVTFFCGALIGVRGLTAKRASALRWPILGAYALMLFLYLISDASFREGAGMIAFASVGVLASVAVSFAALRWFPLRGLHDVV